MSDTGTTIDWLRFRTQGNPGEVLQGVRGLFGTIGEGLKLGQHGRGALGFQHHLPIVIGDVPLGRIDFGGDSQRGWARVDFGGKGLQWVQDWDAIEDIEALPSCELRRVDIALTTWKGEVTHDQVVQAHASGRFSTGGRPPNLQRIEHSQEHRGRTCYVGDRKGDKFLRAYEKGYELASKLGPMAATITSIDGFNVEDIYRVEVELKSHGMPIPWETIERRDQYFAGAYPFCADVLPGIEPDILQRRPEKAPQRELAAALAH